jgi:hypothetical protein
MTPEEQWDALNEEYKREKERLLLALSELDGWYQRQFELIDLPSCNSTPL